VIIPNIASNNYALKLANISSMSNNEQIDIAKHWPTLVPVTTEKGTTIQQCPLNMHMLLWGVREETVLARVFHHTSSYAFSPELGKEGVLHYVSYGGNAFPDTNGERDLPSFTDVSLKPDEYLFVPYNYMSALKLATSSPATTETESETVHDKYGTHTVLKLCFFDASNLNHVRDALGIEALISSVSQQMSVLLSSPSLFHFAMEKEPVDKNLVTYLEGSKVVDSAPESTKGRDRSNRGNFKGMLIIYSFRY
jgi:hypothetical protein